MKLNVSENGDIDKDLSRVLVGYLANRSKTSPLFFLSGMHRRAILKHSKNEDIFSDTQKLGKIWPDMITGALIYLKRKDNRECPNNVTTSAPHSFIHEESLGVQKLKEILDSFSQFEGMLYGASPEQYRDHIKHVFRVWLLGCRIIQEKLMSNLEIFDMPEKDISISSSEWYAMWTIASLCHDLGYPLANIEKINIQAKKSLESMGVSDRIFWLGIMRHVVGPN
ncbi:MAG: hypothetical protein K8S55_04205, partial [Phycisphaerae bacterium]|nr:hypothetical protein [Phycisphaerae bacterium]